MLREKQIRHRRNEYYTLLILDALEMLRMFWPDDCELYDKHYPLAK